MPLPLPSRTDAWRILRDASPPDWVLRHVACVEALAVAMAQKAMANGHAVDMELLHAGAILHDVGRSITQDPTHAHRGARLLEQGGHDARLVRVVERHTGAGLTAADNQGLGLPAVDQIPESLEEQIVAHADNLYSGDKRLGLEQLKGKYLAKDLPDAFARIEALHAFLTQRCGTDLESLAPAPLPAA